MVYLAKSEASIFYEASYSNDNSLFLSINGDNFFITDGRYIEESIKNTKNCEVVESRDVVKKAKEILRSKKVKKIFIDPLEWSIDEFDKLDHLIRIEKRKGLLSKKRAVKTLEEIAKIKKAVEIGKSAFDKFAVFIRENGFGMSEKELNWKAKEILSSLGENELSFEPITAIDANSSLPHARVTDTKLKKESVLLFDAGVKVNGFCSDMTRTACFDDNFHFGYEQKFKSKQMQRIYDIVLKAHDDAIFTAKPGMKAKELDKIARDIIERAGYAKEFVHSLGHGVGIEIHEYPTVSAKSETILEEGMVFTVEPGIYLPGIGGVRIEDMVVMKSGGAELL